MSRLNHEKMRARDRAKAAEFRRSGKTRNVPFSLASLLSDAEKKARRPETLAFLHGVQKYAVKHGKISPKQRAIVERIARG